MRKSSLGKRSSSMLPTRVGSRTSVSELPDGAKQGVKSMIPRPPRSRSSSIDRNAPVMNKPSAAVATPVVTPMQPGMCASVIRKKALSEKSSKGTKDMRPLTDKNFQILAIQNIYNYFKENNAVEINIVPKTLSSCSFTLKSFVEISNHLFSRIFGNEEINMKNYTEKIPQLAKAVGYPNVVKKSWLVTANSPHSLPQVIGLLSWLLDAIKVIDCMPEVMFANAEQNQDLAENCEDHDDFNYFSSERMFQYYVACYDKYSKGQSHDFEDQQLGQEALDRLKINDEDFAVVQNTLLRLQQELEKPEVVREIEENKELQNTKAKLLAELGATEKYFQQKVAYYNEQQQKLQEIEHNIASIETRKERCVQTLSKMSEHLKTQRCSREDIASKEKRCSELEKAIKLDEASIDMWSKENYALELEMTNLRSKLNVLLQDYTTIIVKNTDMFPEVEDFKVQVYLSKDDATSELQEVAEHRERYLKKLQAEAQEKEAIYSEKQETIQALEQKLQSLSKALSQENMKVENLKQELSVLNESSEKQKQNQVDKLKWLQDEINTCKEDISESVALEKKYLELLEVDRKVTEHIKSVHEEAEIVFQKLKTIHKEQIDKIMAEFKPLFDLLN